MKYKVSVGYSTSFVFDDPEEAFDFISLAAEHITEDYEIRMVVIREENEDDK